MASWAFPIFTKLVNELFLTWAQREVRFWSSLIIVSTEETWSANILFETFRYSYNSLYLQVTIRLSNISPPLQFAMLQFTILKLATLQFANLLLANL